jgi:hypothetical protein
MCMRIRRTVGGLIGRRMRTMIRRSLGYRGGDDWSREFRTSLGFRFSTYKHIHRNLQGSR